MTDEEMAEEYVRNHVYYEVAKRENGAEYTKEVSNVTVKEAFLAGLKAGRLHGDLPPIKIGCCSIGVLTDNGNTKN